MFGVVYARALGHGDRGVAEGVAQAYLSYMESIFAYFEELSALVLGYEVKQILLLHADSLNADYFDALVRMMRRRGYSFISIEQALEDAAYHRPDTYSGEQGLSWIHHWAFTMRKNTPRGPEVPEFVRKQYETRPH